MKFIDDASIKVWTHLVKHIYITADHGFIYRDDKLEVSDKIDKLKINAKEVKRRGIISEEESNKVGILNIDLSYIFEEYRR